MAIKSVKAPKGAKPFTTSKSHLGSRKLIRSVVCQASPDVDRRDVLFGGAAALAAPFILTSQANAEEKPKKFMSVSQLGAFQRADQRKEFQATAEGILSKELTGADSTACMRLVFNDAATYDEATKTGGMDGSIVLSEELNRPENKEFAPVVARLAKCKEEIDAAGAVTGAGPISWADLLVLAAKVSTERAWAAAKIAGAKTGAGGRVIAENFKADWPVLLGRLDVSTPAPAGRLPASDASVDEIREFMLKLGAKPEQQNPGPFTPKPPFWERPAFVIYTAASPNPAEAEERLAAGNPVFAQYKKKYDTSRETITRTEYEVDFISYFTKLTTLGAKFNPEAYLHPTEVAAVRF